MTEREGLRMTEREGFGMTIAKRGISLLVSFIVRLRRTPRNDISFIAFVLERKKDVKAGWEIKKAYGKL